MSNTIIPLWKREDDRPNPGQVLREAREEMGMAHAELALVIGEILGRPDLTAPTIRVWEGGRIPPPTDVVEAVVEMRRRQFLEAMGGGLLALATLPRSLEQWAEVMAALRRPRLLDTDAVAGLAQMTATLESMEPKQISHLALVGPVGGHLESVTEILRSPMMPAMRRQVTSILGETHALAGWVEWNLANKAGALTHLQAAARAAHEADDRELAAYLTGCAACWLDQEPHAKLTRLQGEPFGARQTEASPWTRVWLAAKEADACAAVGDVAGCVRALERAETAKSQAGEDQEAARPRWHRWDGTWLRGEQGASMSRLGRVDAARQLLDSAIASMGKERSKDRPWLQLATARMYIDEEPDQAVHLATQILTHAAELRSSPLLGEIRGLREELSHRWAGSAALRDLDGMLEAQSAR